MIVLRFLQAAESARRVSRSASRASVFRIVLLALLVAGLLPATVAAQQVALGVRAGTPGVGAEATVQMTDRFNARAGASYFAYNRTDATTAGDVPLSLASDVRLLNGSVIVDYFPWASRGFHLSLGAYVNGNLGDVNVEVAEPYTLGARTFSPEDVGQLQGEISFPLVSPYAGLGFGNAVSLNRRVGVALDLGVIYHRQPSVDLTGTGMVAPTAEQAPQLEENLESFQLFPVLSLGLNVRLN